MYVDAYERSWSVVMIGPYKKETVFSLYVNLPRVKELFII